MAEIASAWVSILPSAKGFGSKLNSEVGGEVNGVGKKLGTGFGKLFAAAAAIGIGAKVVDFFGSAIEEAREAAVVTARTENVIKSMGNAAGITAEQVAAMAGRLSHLTGIDDEVIQGGENMLLTFGNIKNFVGGEFVGTFDQATALMVDMSAAMGTDMKSSAIQLGKALNDPIKGVSALTRVGVSFTEQQKEQITALVESGELVKAQGIIMGEVKKQFGGAAEAMATPAMKAAVAWGNFKETVGTLLLPVIDQLLTRFTPLIAQLGTALPGAISAVQAALAPVVSTIRDILQPVLDRVGTWMQENPTFVRAFAISLGVLVGAITAVTLATALFSAALQTTGIPLVIIAIAALVAGLVVAYQKSETFRAIVQQVGVVLRDVGAALVEFGNWVRTNVIPVLVQLAQKVGSNLRPILVQLGQTFRNDILPAVQQLIAKFREWQPTIQRVAGVVLQLVAKLIDFYTTVLGKVLPVLIKFAGFIISTVVPAVIKYVEAVAKIIGKLIEFGAKVVEVGKKIVAFAQTVGKKIDEVVGFFKALPGRILSAIGDLGNLLYEKGRDLVQGLIDGIKSVDISDAVGGLLNGIGGILNKTTTVLPSSTLGPTGWTEVPVDTSRTLSPIAGRSRESQVVAELRLLRAAVDRVAPGVTRGINGAVADGHRRRVPA